MLTLTVLFIVFQYEFNPRIFYLYIIVRSTYSCVCFGLESHRAWEIHIRKNRFHTNHTCFLNVLSQLKALA